MTTLRQYFTLQFTIFKRQLIELGLNPFLGFILIIIAFYGFSNYLFAKTEYANYLYIIIALRVILPYSEINRNDFLKFTFPKKIYFKIRILENLIAVLPFIIFLCYKVAFYPILLLVILSILISFFNVNKKIILVIPTPFYRKPFEFIVGFRKLLIGFLFAYFLTLISVLYDNFNLGIFSLALVFLICLSFYIEPEKEFYVWIYKFKVNGFIFNKVLTAILHSTIVSLPITITLIVFFQIDGKAVIAFQALAYFYLVMIVLAKYAAYPKKMSLQQGILLALGTSMPPLLLVLIPFFYIQSQYRLKEILE
jgi:hypothetical protein